MNDLQRCPGCNVVIGRFAAKTDAQDNPNTPFPTIYCRVTGAKYLLESVHISKRATSKKENKRHNKKGRRKFLDAVALAEGEVQEPNRGRKRAGKPQTTI